MHLILTGATGLVGTGVLDAMLKAKDITRITILSRRPVPMAEAAAGPRVNVILHSDFSSAQGVVWALGTSQSQVTADVGATPTPGMFTPIFGRLKGETEAALARTNSPSSEFVATTMRPAFVDEAGHAAIEEFGPKRSAMYHGLTGVVRVVVNNFASMCHSPTEPLGRFLVELAMSKWDGVEGKGVEHIPGPEGEGSGTVWSNSAARRIAGFDEISSHDPSSQGLASALFGVERV